MITKQTNKNKPIYDELYKEINQFLYGKESSEDEHLITDLNDYFHVLPELISKMNEPGFKPKFIILPVDEDLFEINANTREITVPASFKKGAGVVGDQVAEIIYFSIDRYFDTMDLNNQNIYIEWIGPKGQDGVSQELIRDISKPGKIIFGWALHNEITQDPGTVEFAIRFWSKNKTGEIEYVLRTLPQRITINNGLNLDSLEDDKNIFDESKQKFIFDRIVKSVLDDNINDPEQATILTLYYTYEDGIDEKGLPIIVIKNIKDYVLKHKEFKMIEHPEGEYNLYVSAGSARGVLKYLLEWGDNIKYTASSVYELTLDKEFNQSKAYYIKNANEGYDLYVKKETDPFPTEDDLKTFYEELYVFKFKSKNENASNTDIVGVGDFLLDVTNRISLKATSLDPKILVQKPGPANPTEGWGDDNFEGVVFGKNATSESKVVLKLNEEQKPIHTENDEETTYKWYEVVGEKDIELDNTLPELTVTYDENVNEKNYKMYPINKLNGVYTPETTSFNYRVTKYPESFSKEEQFEFIIQKNEEENPISVRIVPTNKDIFSDSLKYIVHFNENWTATPEQTGFSSDGKIYTNLNTYNFSASGAYKFELWNVVNDKESDESYVSDYIVRTYIK